MRKVSGIGVRHIKSGQGVDLDLPVSPTQLDNPLLKVWDV
jgi:hypothetical protein